MTNLPKITSEMATNNINRYQIVNGVNYKKDTTDTVVKILEDARLNGIRVSLLYGDVKTGEAWKGNNVCCGYIGKNSHNLPILLATKQSAGGACVMDSSILEIKEAKSGKLLYQRSCDESLLVEETLKEPVAPIQVAV